MQRWLLGRFDGMMKEEEEVPTLEQACYLEQGTYAMHTR